MLGITVLVVVISVMTGFDHELRERILGFDPHIVVTNDGVMSNWRTLERKINATPGVVASAPFVQGPVIVDHDGRIRTDCSSPYAMALISTRNKKLSTSAGW